MLEGYQQQQGGKPQNGISAVTVKENDNWKQIDTKNEVEEASMSNNSARFHLTSDTPLMQPDAVKKLDILQMLPLLIQSWKGPLQRTRTSMSLPINFFTLYHNGKNSHPSHPI